MAFDYRSGAAVSRTLSQDMRVNGLPVAERYDFLSGDGVPLRLTRYVGGTKGPVLLVHGAGVWSGMFMLPTLKENFVQHLVRHGYDTWLLDWRASVQLPLRQFTLDDAADHDMPAAVRRVREITGAESVQAVVHCAGSAAFFMSMAAGHLSDVRTVVASQVALHHDTPASTRLKALLRVPELLDMGLDSLTPDDASRTPLFQAAFTKVAGFLRMECDSPVCHRLSFMYGRLYRHARLNAETHARLEEQFGKCNLLTFRHLGQMARGGRAVKFDFGRAENLRRYGQARPRTIWIRSPSGAPSPSSPASRTAPTCRRPRSARSSGCARRTARATTSAARCRATGTWTPSWAAPPRRTPTRCCARRWSSSPADGRLPVRAPPGKQEAGRPPGADGDPPAGAYRWADGGVLFPRSATWRPG